MALTEKSYFWTTGTTNDGASTFTQADLSEALRILASCQASVGVSGVYLNAFAATIPGANNVQIDTGAAIVDGKPYSNLGAGNVAIPSAVGGGNTRIDRVVLRADWANHQVRLTRIAGTDAASPSAPAITQTPGTTYDVMLYQVTVNTSGTVTVTTDERVFAQVSGLNQIANLLITAAKIAAATITGAKIANATITTTQISASAGIVGTQLANETLGPTQIADRSRSIGVPCYGAMWGSTNFFPSIARGGAWNVGVQGKDSHYWGHFRVPSDYVSGMTVTVLLDPTFSGNLYAGMVITSTAPGSAIPGHTATLAMAAVAATTGNMNSICSTALASIAAGDIVHIDFHNDASNAADTVAFNNFSPSIYGFQVTYTADS